MKAIYTSRWASLEDLPKLRAMHHVSLVRLGEAYYRRSQIEGFLADFDTVDESLITSGKYCVVETGGAIVASGGWTRQEPSYASHVPVEHGSGMPARTAWIRAVFTHPDFTRRGLARQIVQSCESTAAKEDGLTSLALCATLSGCNMYAALGYLPASPVVLPLSNGESFASILMTKVWAPSVSPP